ncbi:DUF488 domain-containing protein [Patescibacteria group bacterium]|nr:DUF488 domain-containing protein [Patescibacteria group bacterium]MCL5114816.1 DUF488 domain-containing protein [Patescibacteria group bacterium]
MKKLYTIGHSTRTADYFISILKAHGVEELIDVRTIPKSRHNPQFGRENLRNSLRGRGIGYRWLGKELGGLRRTKKDSENTGWQNLSFRGFADYMQTPEFEAGLKKLQSVAAKKATAIMCAEAVPWRCHRSLIADAMTKKGWKVYHISSRKTARLHTLTPFLKIVKGRLLYP